MSDSGDSASTAPASTSTAAVDAIDWDDPPLDLPNFFFEAERHSALDYVGTFLRVSIQQMYLRVANYHDDIVADLPHFLEMATYEDPLDDIPVFLERASRWACSKRVVGPEGTFYLFAELPCEIRLMIWEKCIPSQVHLAVERVHETRVAQKVYGNNQQLAEIMSNMLGLVDSLLLGGQPYHSRYCNSAYRESSGQKTPVIAKVNHEARMLALERKSKRYNLAIACQDGSKGPIHEVPVWIDEKNDTVLINTQYTDAIKSPEDASEARLPNDRRCDLEADRLFGLVSRNRVRVAICAGGIIGNTPRPGFCKALTNAEQVSVVVGVFRFDGMTDNEAAVTELFGFFGEESMALVPAKDSESLRKLFMAHRAFCPQSASEPPNSYVGHYVDFVVTETSSARYKKWFPLSGMRCRPSDFEEYCEEMRGFASSVMAACAYSLAMWNEGGTNEFLSKLEAAFMNSTTFQPVFLLHRCREWVLVTRG